MITHGRRKLHAVALLIRAAGVRAPGAPGCRVTRPKLTRSVWPADGNYHRDDCSRGR